MKSGGIILLFGCFTFLAGCTLEESDAPQLLLLTREYDFSQGTQEWSAGFSDFPSDPKDSAAFELKYDYAEPAESLVTKRSVMLSGNNVNSDLFMFLKRRIDGLQPNKSYTLTFAVDMATDLKGTVSSSDGAVYLKAGAVGMEPRSLIDRGQYVMNIDKGNHGLAGNDMISLGDIRVASTTASYSLVTRNNTMANSRYTARANSNGELWLIIGTDSNLAGTTTLYYTRINVVISAS